MTAPPNFYNGDITDAALDRLEAAAMTRFKLDNQLDDHGLKLAALLDPMVKFAVLRYIWNEALIYSLIGEAEWDKRWKEMASNES